MYGMGVDRGSVRTALKLLLLLLEKSKKNMTYIKK